MGFQKRGRQIEEIHLTSQLFGNLRDETLTLEGNRGVERSLGTTAAASRGQSAAQPVDGGTGPLRGVWNDPDDATTNINVAKSAKFRKLRTDESDAKLTGTMFVQRIRTEHTRLHQGTNWAVFSSEALPAVGNKEHTQAGERRSPGELSHLFRDAGAFVSEDDGVSSAGRVLPQGKVEATRMQDANASEPSDAVIRSVQFHPNGSLLLTAGLDKAVRLFDVDGSKNAKVQSVFFNDLPIRKACFSSDGTQVIVAGRRKHFYTYDLQGGTTERVSPLIGREEKSLESFILSPTCVHKPLLAFLGADGHVPLVSLDSRSYVGSVKMNGTARSAAFSANGLHLLTGGGDGTVYIWDLRNQRRCIERIVDEGALSVTSLATSPTGKHLSTGSDSGVVNVYDTAAPSSAERVNSLTLKDRSGLDREIKREPIRAIMNLTTSIDTLTFNSDGQMLAISSRLKRDALKLVHIPSCTVFSNWPSSKSPLHYVWCTSFSPTGGYLAVGNARGRALLYRIRAYDV